MTFFPAILSRLPKGSRKMNSGFPVFRFPGLPLLCVFFLSAALPVLAQGQKIRIVPGPSSIAANEFYTITLTVQDQELKDYSAFPRIPGFSKGGISTSSSMSSFNGRVTNETSVTQNYVPTAQGAFTLSPFTMKVNGQTVRCPGAGIRVGPPRQGQSADPFGSNPFAYDPFEDFFPKTRASGKADAFFSVVPDKKEIWAGEGVNLTISFFVSEDNAADMTFYQAGEQLDGFLKKIKPRNAWEENFGLDEIESTKVKIGKKNYTEYRLYQGTLFPLTAQDIQVPALGLKMSVLKGQGFAFGARPEEELRTFESKPFVIRVKELPDHPLKGKVGIGRFTLAEKLGKPRVRINEGVPYELSVTGEGNISTIPDPLSPGSSMIDLYPPNTRQTIQRAGGRVTGSKTFSYLLVPKESGKVELRRVLNWVYFNTATGRYDTLSPQASFWVMKGKESGAGSSARKQDSFYDLIDKADSRLMVLGLRRREGLLWINSGVGAMAVIALLLPLFRRRGQS